MGSLNPQWLIIELDLIDATIENWSCALSDSYAATVQTLLNEKVAQLDLDDLINDLEEIAA